MEILFGFLFFLACMYVFLHIMGSAFNSNSKNSRKFMSHRDLLIETRRNALREASIYLSPYKDIWKNLRLSNRHCSLLLGEDGETISAIEKVPPFRKFIITASAVHTFPDLWNYFCLRFAYNTSFDGLKEQCRILKASYTETFATSHNNRTVQDENVIHLSESSDQKKVDINNCSEIELTELPGVSIVLAKKAIKKRDEIGGFKSAEDFFLFLHLKPHLQNQLKNLIIVEKMKNKPKHFLNKERKIDL